MSNATKKTQATKQTVRHLAVRSDLKAGQDGPALYIDGVRITGYEDFLQPHPEQR